MHKKNVFRVLGLFICCQRPLHNPYSISETWQKYSLPKEQVLHSAVGYMVLADVKKLKAIIMFEAMHVVQEKYLEQNE